MICTWCFVLLSHAPLAGNRLLVELIIWQLCSRRSGCSISGIVIGFGQECLLSGGEELVGCICCMGFKVRLLILGIRLIWKIDICKHSISLLPKVWKFHSCSLAFTAAVVKADSSTAKDAGQRRWCCQVNSCVKEMCCIWWPQVMHFCGYTIRAMACKYIQ